MRTPKSWGDITLQQFDQLTEIHQSELNQVEKAIRKLAVLTNKDRDYWASKTLAEVYQEIDRMSFLDTLPQSENIPKTITIKGVEYRVDTNIASMPSGMYLDILNTVREHQDDQCQGWAYLCGIIMYEHGEPYDYERSRRKAEVFYEHMTVEQVYPIIGFFLKFWTDLLGSIVDSSMERLNTHVREMMEIVSEDLESLDSGGDGTATLVK